MVLSKIKPNSTNLTQWSAPLWDCFYLKRFSLSSWGKPSKDTHLWELWRFLIVKVANKFFSPENLTNSNRSFLGSKKTSLKIILLLQQRYSSRITWFQVGSSEVKRRKRFLLQWGNFGSNMIRFAERSISRSKSSNVSNANWSKSRPRSSLLKMMYFGKPRTSHPLKQRWSKLLRSAHMRWWSSTSTAIW